MKRFAVKPVGKEGLCVVVDRVLNRYVALGSSLACREEIEVGDTVSELLSFLERNGFEKSEIERVRRELEGSDVLTEIMRFGEELIRDLI